MIIKTLTMENFRQFYDKSTINFGEGDKNITIIKGDNGNGKTGIFRAVMFAFYGDETLDQDGDSKSVGLVNQDRLNESPDQPVTATVELKFEHEGHVYIIKRSISSTMLNGSLESHQGESELGEYLPSGDFEKQNVDIDEFVNNILDKDIREFFFFDAEKMGILDNTKSSRSMSKQVKDGIIKLLQIKSLDSSTKALNDMVISKERIIGRKSKDSNTNEKINQRDDLQSSLNNNNQKISSWKKDYKLTSQEIKSNEEKLNVNKDIQDLHKDMDSEKRVLDSENISLEKSKRDLRSMYKDAIYHLADDTLNVNKDRFRNLQAQNRDEFSLDTIKESLDDKKCALCQTDIQEGSRQQQILTKLKEAYEFSDMTPVVSNIIRTTDKQLDIKQSFVSGLHDMIEEVFVSNDKVEISERKLDSIKDKIGDVSIDFKNLDEIKNHLDDNKADLKNIESKIAYANNQNEDYQKNIEGLEKEISELTKKNVELQHDNHVLETLKEMKSILKSITTDYTDSVVKDLEFEMGKTLHTLLNDKDTNMFSKVDIDSDYNIRLLDESGIDQIPDMSKGQGQMFTLSFIVTLSKLASDGRTEINFPLFMDTPFGRLDETNRSSLIENIPNMTNQWVLLFTDTELTNVEANLFRKYNKVGKIYELDKEFGKTEINEKRSLDGLGLRG